MYWLGLTFYDTAKQMYTNLLESSWSKFNFVLRWRSMLSSAFFCRRKFKIFRFSPRSIADNIFSHIFTQISYVFLLKSILTIWLYEIFSSSNFVLVLKSILDSWLKPKIRYFKSILTLKSNVDNLLSSKLR